jgi:hypothetical protein
MSEKHFEKQKHGDLDLRHKNKLSDIIVFSNKAHNSGLFVFRISKEKCDPRHVILIKLNSPN